MAKLAYESIHAAICEDSLTECLEEGRGLCLKAARGLSSEGWVVLSAKEYDSLERDSDWLGYLEAAGVDNWDGYDEAHNLRREAEEDD